VTLDELRALSTDAIAKTAPHLAPFVEFDIQMRLFTATQMQLAREADERQAAALERIANALEHRPNEFNLFDVIGRAIK
jgi:hypothetical protein